MMEIEYPIDVRAAERAIQKIRMEDEAETLIYGSHLAMYDDTDTYILGLVSFINGLDQGLPMK